MPVHVDAVNFVLQQYLYEHGIPRSVTDQVTAESVLASVKAELAAQQSPPPTTPGAVPPAQQAQQPPAAPVDSSPRDSVIDASVNHSASAPAAEAPQSTPEAPEAFETQEREAPAEGEDSEHLDETVQDHISDSGLDHDTESVTSTPEPSAGWQSIEYPGVLTYELTALEPSATALSADPKRFKAKEVALRDCIEYLILRLAAVCIILVRHDNVARAIPFGQFAVDLYGQTIFASALTYYENAAFEDEDALDDDDEDLIEVAKRCISDCVYVLKQNWHDQSRMATKLHNIAVAEQMYRDPALDVVAPVSETPARAPGGSPSKGVTKKKIEKNRTSSGPPVKGVARKVHKEKKNRANRAKIVRAGYDEDEWQQ